MALPDNYRVSTYKSLPRFFSYMPRTWFSHFEAKLHSEHRKEEIMFHIVSLKLGIEEVNVISDYIEHQPEQQPYTKMKQRLLKACLKKAHVAYQNLVQEMHLGPQRPSQLFAEMRQLSMNFDLEDDTVKYLWLAKLPGLARAILASSYSSGMEINELCGLADRIMENLRNEFAVVDGPAMTELLDHMKQMSLDLKKLKAEMTSIKNHLYHPNYYRRYRSTSCPRFAEQGHPLSSIHHVD